MKFPKNRANIYIVVREDYHNGELTNLATIGVFSDVEEADNFKDSCAAEWFEMLGDAGCKFDVRLSTYYG